MNRSQKLKMNTFMSILTRLVSITSGLILPRLILLSFGSEINGLVSSITKFLGIITFLDLGVGAVVKSALYRPIAKKDNKQLSAVIIGAKKYFQRIAYILIIYVLVLIVFYPYLIDSNYGYLSTALLIFSLSLNQFGRYYFGIVNELLLSANQQDYIQFGSEIVVIIFNLIINIFLISQGATIEIVKLGSSLVYLIRPLFLSYYVNKNFNIDYNMEVEEDPLPQKWSGMGQYIAYSIQSGADVVVLTLLSTLESISVYAVYNMVVSAINMLMGSLTTGIQSFFGDLYANDEISLLNKYFDEIEWIVHTMVVYLYGMTAVLINSFIMLYTIGVDDISYEAPLFSLLLVLANVAYSLMSPYQTIVFSVGHFKQTQMSSYVEAGINIAILLIFVNRFGLVGVPVGALVAKTYRTLYLVSYLSRNILFRSVKKFVKHIFVDFLSMAAIFGTGIIITNMYHIETLMNWVIVAAILGIISLALLLIINLIFYKDVMVSTVRSVLKSN